MIYDVLEQDFLKKTSRYKYNRTIKRIFIIANFIILIYLCILILLVHFQILQNALHPLWIGSLILIYLTFGTIKVIYPDYYYEKNKKENKEDRKQRSFKERVIDFFGSQDVLNLNVKNLLFESSVNELIILLKKEKMDSKTKLKILIEHYERIQTSKIPLVFPYLVLLSIIISIIALYFTVGETYREEALGLVGLAIAFLTVAFIELKIFRFIDKKMFNTSEKYDYLLILLTDIYLNRFNGNYLPVPSEK